ncbi:MAG TPA: hypothetical protein VMH85_18900 [Terriglobales bacterium]|nr:hypothetical protein [Terriglobales bacterium]
MTREEESIISSIQAVLTPELIPKNFGGRPDNPMFGHCYGAAEALYHLLGGNEHGYKAQRAVDDDGISHWWVLSPTQEILDPTAAQYTSFGKRPPYDKGRGASFRILSKRADIIISRVKQKFNGTTPQE